MERIVEVLDNENVKYDIYDNSAIIEFWTDTAGQDIPVELDYDGTPEDLVNKFSEYANNYDVDEEVQVYVGMLGKNGVPNTVRELIDDCQETKDTLMELARKFRVAIGKEEDKKPEVDMTSSHSESDIYNGCIALMNKLTDSFIDYLNYLGVNDSDIAEDERTVLTMPATEIVERLFLHNTSHSGGTSCRMKLKELGIEDEYVKFEI